MCEIRATLYAIQRSLWKGTRLILLCVYQTGGIARYLLPIWLHILTLTTKARTRLAVTTPSRKLTVWVALTCEVWQWMELLTMCEGKWKMTRTPFQRKLTANRLCRTGQPVVVNPLIVMVLISFNLIFMSFCYGFNLVKFEWGEIVKICVLLPRHHDCKAECCHGNSGQLACVYRSERRMRRSQ